MPYSPSFMGGVRVAMGDVNGDGTLDIITAPGPGGGPHVQVFDGKTLALLASFYAYYPSFSGGVFVAAGDVNGDGKADIITGAGPGGGPHVEVFSGADLSLLASFYAYSPYFSGGVSVAAGDVNGDGKADIVTGAGPSGGPHVEVFSGADLGLLASFYAYSPYFPGGVNVAAGDVNNDGKADIITGAGPSGGPHVRVFSGANLGELASYFAYDPAFAGGVVVTVGDFNQDGTPDVITGPGWGGGPHVIVFNGAGPGVLASFMAFGGGGGAFVGANAERSLRFTSPPATESVVGTPGTFTVTTVGQPPPALTLTGALPTGVSFADNGNGTATIAGTPAAGSAGTYAVTITAVNAIGSATQNFTFTTKEAPTFTSAAAVGFTTDVAGSFTVTTTGFPTAALTLAGALPAGVTFVDNGNGTGTLSGTAPAGAGGSYNLTFAATNGVGAGASQPFVLNVSGAPTITSAAAATFTAGVPGTFTVVAAGTPTPALAVAGPLPAGVTFVDAGNGMGTLSGTPAAGTGGVYPLTFTATNSVSSATQSFTLTVLQAPSITSAGATTFTVGMPGAFTVTTTGLPLPSLAAGGAALPAGVVFVDNGNGTGTLTGTPAIGTGGVYNIQLSAANSVGSSAPQAFALTVNESPDLTSVNTFTLAVGVGASFTLTSKGFPRPTIANSGIALPSGVTFVDNGDGTGTLSGTPGAGAAGAHVLTFTLTNGVGASVVRTFTLNVNEGPIITSASSTTFAVGATNSFTVAASGFPAPSLVQGGATLPAGVTWVDNGDGTGTLSGTPDAGTGGDYALTFTASNVRGSAVQNFTLTVAGSPGFTSADTTTFAVGAAGTFTVTAIGAPPPALTFSGSLPSGVTFVDNGGGSGTLSGTPAAGTGGTYALTFTAANGVLPDGTQAFTLNVNEGPVITSTASATFTIGNAGTFSVTTSGLPVPTLTIGGVALPAGVTFVDNGTGTGTLSGTPAAGTGGTYALSFTATNTIGSSAPQAFTLTVSGTPSITSAATTTFTVGTLSTFTVTAIGSPAPALTVGGSLPAGVAFLDNGNGTGTLSGMPGAATGGSYALTFTASNGVLPDGTQAFTLVVNQAPTVTSANSTTFPLNTAGSFTVTTAGFPTPTVTLTGTLPAGVTFVNNGNGTATLSGTPTATGTFPLQFAAANGVGNPAVQSFTLTVSQPPAITSAASTTFTEDVAGSFTVTTQGFPTPALSVTGTLPAGVTLLDNGNGTATLAGTAAAGGSFPLTITATNGVGSPATQNFTLTVLEVNDAPSFTVAGNPPTVNEDAGPQTVAAFATLISAGSANEAGQVLTFVVQNNSTPGLFSIAPAVSATGTLTYTSAPNAFGTATITLVLQDNGGTANGGVNTSAPQMFTITVLAVNDPPLVVNETFDVLGNTELRVDLAAGTTPHTTETTTNPNTAQGVLDNDGDPEGDPFAVTAITGCADTTAPFDCTLPGGAVIQVQVNGAFSYIPGPGATTGSFTYTVTDTPAQGTAASVNGTVTFTIAEMVWYVKNDGAAGGNGTSRAPLNALTTLNGAGGAGDVDDGNDYIFVDFGDGTSTGQVGGLELEAGQQLIGEFVGLSIPVNLNGNGSPTVVVPAPAAADCSGGPCRPLLSHATGNALSITEAMPAAIRGFRLAGGSAGNAIDVTTDGALTGSGTLTIADNVFQGAGLEGLDVNMIVGTTGTLALTVLGNTWDNAAAHIGNAVDINRLSGTLNLTFSSNVNIESAANAVVIDGGVSTATSIIALTNNTVHTDTVGTGMFISNVTFDAVPGGAVDAVAGGVLTIGVDGNGVGGAGLTLSNVRGNLGFTDLDVYGGTSGLTVTGDATLGVVLTVVPPGSGGSSEAKGTSGAAVAITNAAINLQLAELASSTAVAGGGVSLTTVSGTFSAPIGSTIVKNGGGGAAFTVNNSAAGTTALTATYAGTINNTSGTGGSVSVTSADAGSSVSFTGAITANPGIGISLSGNTGATVSFSGGLTLNSGANAAFTASGGGTVQVCDENPCSPAATGALVNTITTTTGTALNVANTTIGANNLEFRSISSNGGSSTGVIVDTTGSVGGLKIKGTGSAGSGGTIANKSGADGSTTTGVGIYLNNTANVSLSFMQLNDFENFGIRGSNVSGFTLTSTTINALDASPINGTLQAEGTGEGSIRFDNLMGIVSITDSTITHGVYDNVGIFNTNTPTALNFTASNTTFATTTALNTGNDALRFEIDDTVAGAPQVQAQITINNDCDFTAARGDLLDVIGQKTIVAGTAANAAIVDVDIIGNDFSNNHSGIASGGGGFIVHGNGNVTFTINDNDAQDARGRALNISKGATAGIFSGTINNNRIGVTGVTTSGSDESSGIFVDGGGAGSMVVAITNNVVRRTSEAGIFIVANNQTISGNNATLNVTVSGNSVFEPHATLSFAGIWTDIGTGVNSDATTACLDIGGAGVLANDFSNGDPFNAGDINLSVQANSVLRLRDYAGANNNDAQITSYLTGRNLSPGTTTVSLGHTGTMTTNLGACIVP